MDFHVTVGLGVDFMACQGKIMQQGSTNINYT